MCDCWSETTTTVWLIIIIYCLSHINYIIDQVPSGCCLGIAIGVECANVTGCAPDRICSFEDYNRPEQTVASNTVLIWIEKMMATPRAEDFKVWACQFVIFRFILDIDTL